MEHCWSAVALHILLTLYALGPSLHLLKNKSKKSIGSVPVMLALSPGLPVNGTSVKKNSIFILLL